MMGNNRRGHRGVPAMPTPIVGQPVILDGPNGGLTPDVDVTPCDGWVLCRKDSLLPPTDGSQIILPAGRTKESFYALRVLKVGDGGRMENGDRWPMRWREGDLAMPAGEAVVMGIPWDDDLVLIEESCLIAEVKKKEVLC